MRKSRTMLAVFCVFLMLCCLPGCRKTSASESASVDDSATAESAGGTRDNTPQVLNPEAPGTSVIGNDLIEIDLSNTAEGYVGARYSGSASRIKIFVITPDSTKYTYDLTASDDWAVSSPDRGRRDLPDRGLRKHPGYFLFYPVQGT